MTLHLNTISPTLHTYLMRLMRCASLSSFYLAGGTALSLQLGHRKSIDIDLFTNIEYGTIDTDQIQRDLSDNFHICEGIECLDNRQLVYTIYIGDTPETIVKLDLCYDEQPIYPIISDNGLRIASDKEIAAMKLLAIVTGNRPKDFWDLYELNQHYELSTMIEWALQRNPYTLSKADILEAFNKIWDFPEPEDIICLKNRRWPFIADELFDEAQKLSLH